MPVVRCLSSAVCYVFVPYVARCSLCVACCALQVASGCVLLLVDCCLLFAVRNALCVVRSLLFIAWRLRRLLFVVCCLCVISVVIC